MADAANMGQLVTRFFVNTCRLCPPPTFEAVGAAQNCIVCAAVPDDDDPEADKVPLTTGSVAEFYIEPMLKCFGDIDIMVHLSTELAIPAGHPPPTQLPADFHNKVRVCEIIDSKWPGYVYLRNHCVLSGANDNKSIVWLPKEVPNAEIYWSLHREGYGPARAEIERCRMSVHRTSVEAQSLDYVRCVRCLEWPPQAAGWPTRHRKYGWPDSATVDRVVSNGCDVVGAVHRHSRQDEWERKSQWRLSFSRAELVLINSWSREQQIVYHMLRTFQKTEQWTQSADDSGAKILSNYHIKTLMLWACELNPQDCWTSDMNYVRICITLLHTLATRIRGVVCSQYFVSNCNLFIHEKSDRMADELASRLESLTEYSLSVWFVDNYIRKCAEMCPQDVSRMFADVTTYAELEKVVSAVAEWKEQTRYIDYFGVFEVGAQVTVNLVHRFSLSVRLIILWLQELKRLFRFPRIHFIAIAFLHVAGRSANCEQRCYDFLEELTAMILHVNGMRPKDCHGPKDATDFFQTAMLLLKLAAQEENKTLVLILSELSKAHLQRVMKFENANDPTLICLSNVYLTALHYITGQYQSTVDTCGLAARESGQLPSHVVEAKLLPKIDGEVDSAFGLVVFFQYVRTAAMCQLQQERQHQQQQQQHAKHVSVLSPKLFALYLHAKSYMSVQNHVIKPLSTRDAICQCRKYINEVQELFASDAMLVKMLLKHADQADRGEHENQITMQQNKPTLRELLLKSAVNILITFRHLEVEHLQIDQDSEVRIATTDFSALYVYKCGNYGRCFRVCLKTLGMLIDAHRTPDIFLYPEFIQLMDEDIVALVGLTLTVNPTCREDVQYGEATAISQTTLMLYLLTQCQLKVPPVETLKERTLELIHEVQLLLPDTRTLDHLTLKLIERKLMMALRSH